MNDLLKPESDSIEYPYPLQQGGKVICQVCGRAFGKIVPSHLRSHGMTYDEYFEKYPDTPTIPDAFKAARYDQKDSVLFKSNEGKEKLVVEHYEAEEEEQIIPDSTMDLTNVPTHKSGILSFLHKHYKHLENNYMVRKLDIQDRVEYEITTDMADPVSKVIFDFPKTFWHNIDFVTDPNKFYKLEQDGWLIIEITNKAPSIEDVEKYIDIMLDAN